MADEKRKLGRGIASLLEMDDDIDTSILANNSQTQNNTDKVVELKLSQIKANKKQPRKYFDDVKLKELSESIKNNGLLQPIIVAKDNNDNEYIIVAGERRCRASKLAGLDTIKAIIVKMDEKDILKNAIIENVQREDLNPVEEANGYRNIIENFGYTHEQLAKEVGKSRAYITNILRILNLPDEALSSLKNGNITLGHAKVLLGCENPNQYVEEIIEKQLSVRQLEKLISNSKQIEDQGINNEGLNDIKNAITNNDDDLLLEEDTKRPKTEDLTFDIIKQMYGIQQNAVANGIDDNGIIKEGELTREEKDTINANLRAIEECIKQASNIDVKLKLNHNGSGKFEIEYQDAEDLLRIVRFFQR